MDEPQSSQDGIPKRKFTYRHLNALSSSTPPKDNPLRYFHSILLLTLDVLFSLIWIASMHKWNKYDWRFLRRSLLQ